MSVINPGDVPIAENVVDGTELARRIERFVAAFHSQNASPTRPPSVTAGGLWVRTGQTGDPTLFMFDGTTDVAVVGDFVLAAGDTMTGDLTFSGNGRRIKGDFTNATVANRTAFQTSVANGQTRVEAIPNGTSDSAMFDVYSKSDPTNCSRLAFGIPAGATEARINSDFTGTGAALPLTIYVDQIERIRFKTDGNIDFTGMGKRLQADFTSSPPSNRTYFQTSMLDSPTSLGVIPSGTAKQAQVSIENSSAVGDAGIVLLSINDVKASVSSTVRGAGQALPLMLNAGGYDAITVRVSGDVGIGGATTVTAGPDFGLNAPGMYTQFGIGTTKLRVGGPGIAFQFYDNANAKRGEVTVSAAGTNYGTTSDYRLKKNVKPLENQLERICSLQPVSFAWKSGGEKCEGFIAHELQAVFPHAVTGEKDGESLQNVDTSMIVHSLVAAIKELKAEVDSLRAQVAAGK